MQKGLAYVLAGVGLSALVGGAFIAGRSDSGSADQRDEVRGASAERRVVTSKRGKPLRESFTNGKYVGEVFELNVNEVGIITPPDVQTRDDVFLRSEIIYKFLMFNRVCGVDALLCRDSLRGGGGNVNVGINIDPRGNGADIKGLAAYLVTSHPIDNLRQVSNESRVKFRGNDVSLQNTSRNMGSFPEVVGKEAERAKRVPMRGYPLLNHGFFDGDTRAYKIFDSEAPTEKQVDGKGKWCFGRALDFEYDANLGLEVALVVESSFVRGGKNENKTFCVARQYSPQIIPELLGDWQLTSSAGRCRLGDTINIGPRGIGYARQGEGFSLFTKNYLRFDDRIEFVGSEDDRTNWLRVYEKGGRVGLALVEGKNEIHLMKVR